MGLGDIFKGAASVAVPGLSGATNLIGNLIQSGGEAALRRGNEARTNPARGDESGDANMGPGIINQRGNPAGQFRNITTNSFLDVGDKYGENLQSQVDMAHGFYNIGHIAVTNPTRITRGVQGAYHAVREDPGLALDAVKTIGTEVAISTMMDPTTYMGGGLFAATAAAENSASRAFAHAAEGAVEETAARVAARSADEVAGSVVREGLEAAPEGLDDALRATRGNPARAATRSGQFTAAVDEMPVNMRERITGNPTGWLGQRRANLGESLMPGPQPNIARSLIKDTLVGSPTMPTEGAGLATRQSMWRAQRVGSTLAAPATARTARQVGLFANDPEQYLRDHQDEARGYAQQGLDWAVREHPEAVAAVGGLVAANAAGGLYSTYKALTGDESGGGEEESAPAEQKQQSVAPPSPHLDTIQEIGLAQFSADRGQAMAGRRRPAPSRRLGTVQRSTMPKSIGPSNWYGPQGGYSAGRGFQQQNRRRDDVLGV